MSNKDQTSSKNNSKLNKTNSSTEKELSTVSKTTELKQTNLKQFLQSKKGQYSLISVLVLGVLLISGLFTYNLLKQEDKAKAANTVATAFNPSDCATYTANGGTAAAGVCFVKLYEKSGQLYSSLDIAPGEVVNVRNYYNNTTTASVTAANITDSIPATFTRVGSVTNNYVDAAPVTLNNNLFTGQNLSVAPGAGYFGYAGDNTTTSSNLELGKKRYWNLNQCTYNLPSTNNYLVSFVNKVGYAFSTGTNASNTPQTGGATCTPYSGWDLVNQDQVVTSLDLLGKRFVNLNQCIYNLPFTNNWITSLVNKVGYGLTTGTNTSNSAQTGGAICTPYSGWDLNQTPANVQAIDILGNRYINLNQCIYNLPTTSSYLTVAINKVGYAFSTGTNASNTPQSGSSTCTTYSGWDLTSTTQAIGTTDTLDIARGYGYISYSMQTPTTGITNGQQVGTTGTLNAGGAKTSGVASSLTITNVPTPNISYTKLYSVDGGTTWSSTVSANPGQSVLVRLWSENTGGIAATSANIKDSLPSPFTYVAGSARNCLNPSTTNPTSPNNTELVCDTGTPTQKDSLFSTLTNASGVSPSAGLYDAAGTSVANGGTAFNAVAGTKEIGKNRYIHEANCSNSSNLIYNGIVEITNTATTTKTCNDAQTGQTWQSSSSILSFDNFSKRYIHEASCWSSTNAVYTGIKAIDNSPTSTLNCNNVQSGQTWLGSSQIQNFSTLGLRYIYEANCWASTSIVYTNIVEITNTATTTKTCNDAQTGQTWLGSSSLKSFDLLDATRSKSYIQYEMIIPAGTAGGNYGTQSSIRSTATVPEFTTVNSGATGTGITVTGDPAFSVKKLLALPTSGTGSSAVCPTSTSSYSTTLSNTPPGSTICVRLAYQNKTSGAVANAAITDTLQSGFTYINNSTSNCLTPSVGSELCASEASQANTNWTGNNGWTGSNFALAPHAGLYGQASSGAGSTASIMEMGKKRYIHNVTCLLSSNYQDTMVYLIDNQLLPNNQVSGLTCLPLYQGSINNPGTSAVPNVDIIGSRYLHNVTCLLSTSFQDTLVYTADNQLLPNNQVSGSTCLPFYQTAVNNPGTTAVPNVDILGNRYIHNVTCLLTNSTQDTLVYAASNSISSTTSCPAIYQGAISNSILFTQDLLDPSNGTGYIQYKMTSPLNPTTASVTLPNVSLAGDSQTTSTGNAVINFNLPAVECSTTDPCALFDTALTYSPTQALAKRYGGSGSSTADNLILTLKDTRLETSGYITTCTFRYKFKSDTTWRSLVSTVAYNNTTGCTSTLLTANQLFWNVDFEITAVTTNGTTTKNYLLYSNYDFKAGSIGVTSIGGSGL